MEVPTKKTLDKALNSAWMILKFVIPIYLLADLLYYFDLLRHVAFVLEPVTTLVGLPAEAALALISGLLLNLYATIAFAAPLDMSPQQWTVLAVFLGVAHSLIVESAVMKQLGLSARYAYGLRIIVAIGVGIIVSGLPEGWFGHELVTTQATATPAHTYTDVWVMLGHSLQGAILLTLKIIALITALIFVMEWIKSLPVFQRNTQHVSKGFTLASGLILGITYGAGVLISEAWSGEMSRGEIFIIGTFLLICHAIIEDTLLFVMFGADALITVTVRTLAAALVTWIVWIVYVEKRMNTY